MKSHTALLWTECADLLVVRVGSGAANMKHKVVGKRRFSRAAIPRRADFTERIRSVCTSIHAVASVHAMGNTLGIKVPMNL